MYSKNYFISFLFFLFIFNCSFADNVPKEVVFCESLFQKLYDQQQISEENEYSLDKHLDSLLVEVSIGEEIMNSQCFDLFRDFEFETYGFIEVDDMTLYKNLVCNLGFELANYRNFAFGRDLDAFLDQNKHCPIGEEFYKSNS